MNYGSLGKNWELDEKLNYFRLHSNWKPTIKKNDRNLGKHCINYVSKFNVFNENILIEIMSPVWREYDEKKNVVD